MSSLYLFFWYRVQVDCDHDLYCSKTDFHILAGAFPFDILYLEGKKTFDDEEHEGVQAGLFKVRIQWFGADLVNL